eukprot:gene4351-7707_t
MKQFFKTKNNPLKKLIHSSMIEKQLDFYSKKKIIPTRNFCGNEFKINETVKLYGWIENIRKINEDFHFIVLRDISGKIQIQYNPKDFNFKNLNVESVIEIDGIVKERPENMKNLKMKNGNIEIFVEKLNLLNETPSNLPIQLKNSEEELRLKYRYIDLRREQLQENLKERSKTLQKIRNYFLDKNFLEIETPTLFKSTPEGSREFLVPTRQKHKFYSLVQSPQQFKQLLMVGGIDKYFQIARCYRDESGRSDRQPEFTQLDIEMSFIQREDVMKLIENLIKIIFENENLKFPILTYDEAMSNYGIDKPDLRIKKKILNFNEFEFPFEKDEFTFGFTMDLTLIPKIKKYKNDLKLVKYKDLNENIINKLEIKENENIILITGKDKMKILKLLGQIRLDIFERNQEEEFKFLWVIDFPLFELNEEDNKIQSVHHPFTSPANKMENDDVFTLKGLNYDIVLNGVEIGGGSLRIHDAKLQEHILVDILKQKREYFTHLLEALKLGAPPHGGVALGLDRLIAIKCNSNSIRDVIAFPKTSTGNELMTNSPSEVKNKAVTVGLGLVVAYITTKFFSGSSTTKKEEKNEKDTTVLHPKEHRKFVLKSKETLTSGEGVLPVVRYRFEIPNNKSLGLPVGQHIKLKCIVDGEEVLRSYTPTSSNSDLGFFELVIKVYPKGKMSQHVDSLKIGDSIDVIGPSGRFQYEKNKFKHIGMLAGGTGITPMLQIIHHIFEEEKDDNTKVSLVYGNLTENDIILREKIEEYANKYENFEVYHVLNNPISKDWSQGVGFISPEIIEKYCPTKPSTDSTVLMCGPGPMIDAMTKILKSKFDFKRENYFTF